MERPCEVQPVRKERRESGEVKTGKNKGNRSIWFNRQKTDRKTKKVTEYCKPQYEKYVAHNFTRLKT